MELLQRITGDRALARVGTEKDTYQLLTRILGDYELGAKAKKPKTGDTPLIEIIRGLMAGNTETIGLLQKTQATDENDAQIRRLENQNVLLGKYLPTMLTDEEIEEILLAQLEAGPVSIGDFQKFMREHYLNKFKPGTVAQIYTANAQKAE